MITTFQGRIVCAVMNIFHANVESKEQSCHGYINEYTHCIVLPVEYHEDAALLKCSLRSLLSKSTKPALPRAVRRVDHVRSSPPVWCSPLSQRSSMSRHALSQSLGWASNTTLLTPISTPNLRATLCHFAATTVTTAHPHLSCLEWTRRLGRLGHWKKLFGNQLTHCVLHCVGQAGLVKWVTEM